MPFECNWKVTKLHMLGTMGIDSSLIEEKRRIVIFTVGSLQNSLNSFCVINIFKLSFDIVLNSEFKKIVKVAW